MNYEYECYDCKHQFTLKMTLSEHDKKKKIKCPQCKGTNVKWHPSKFFAVTSKKS